MLVLHRNDVLTLLYNTKSILRLCTQLWHTAALTRFLNSWKLLRTSIEILDIINT